MLVKVRGKSNISLSFTLFFSQKKFITLFVGCCIRKYILTFLVYVMVDTCTGEIAIRKMVANQVWHLETTKKVIVEINGNGQGNDNGSNLLVRFLGKLAQISTICPLSVERWDWMPKKSSIAQWKYIEVII